MGVLRATYCNECKYTNHVSPELEAAAGTAPISCCIIILRACANACVALLGLSLFVCVLFMLFMLFVPFARLALTI